MVEAEGLKNWNFLLSACQKTTFPILCHMDLPILIEANGLKRRQWWRVLWIFSRIDIDSFSVLEYD